MKHTIIKLDIGFHEFVYTGLKRLKRSRPITTGDLFHAVSMVQKKIELINANSRKDRDQKIISFTKDGLEVDENWLNNLEATPVKIYNKVERRKK